MKKGLSIHGGSGSLSGAFRSGSGNGSRTPAHDGKLGEKSGIADAVIKKLNGLSENPATKKMLMTGARHAFDGQRPQTSSKEEKADLQTQLTALLRKSLQTNESGGSQSPSSTLQDPAGEAPMSAAERRAKVVTTLGRHENLLNGKIDAKSLDKMIDDEKLPTDLRAALKELKDNPELLKELDAAGDKKGKNDGKFSVKDVRVMQNDEDIKAYADEKSESYQQNYVPSDAAPGTPARDINGNDAMRELFRGSESLPKKFNLDDLQKVADGSADTKNASPQLMAAAKYYVDHPDEFHQLTGTTGDQKVGREHFCDLATWKVKLSPDEQKTIDTLNNNQDIFFKKGNLNRDKLKEISEDPKNSEEVRRAATQLGSDKNMLFSMLDNSRHGSAGNVWDKANDKQISKNDLKYFIKQGSGEVTNDGGLDSSYRANGVDDASEHRDLNETLSAKALQNAAEGGAATQEDVSSQKDMQLGLEAQPVDKKQMGGGLKKALEILGNIASVLVSFIPGAGAAALAGNIGRVAAYGAIKAGVSAGAKEGAKAGGKELAKNLGKDFAKEMGKKAGKEAGKEGLKEAGNQLWQEEKTNDPEQRLKNEFLYKL